MLASAGEEPAPARRTPVISAAWSHRLPRRADRLDRLIAKLRRMQARVHTALRQQLAVRPALDHPPALQHQNQIGRKPHRPLERSIWRPLAGGLGTSGRAVYSLAVYNGDLVAGSYVGDEAPGTPSISRWNGTSWNSLG